MNVSWETWETSACALFMAARSAESGADLEITGATPVEIQEPTLPGNALSRAQEQTALQLIDDICADTWCSGDYNFGFRRLSCSQVAKTCTLTLQLFPREDVPGPEPSYFRSCQTAGFEGFDSLVDGADNGYQSLTEGYYDALTDCTTRIVGHLP